MYNKILLFSFILLFVGVTACQKDENSIPQKNYTRVGISKLTIVNYPPIRLDGSNWDSSFQGTYPDVYFKLINWSTGASFYSLSTSSRIENLRPFDLPKGWADPNGAPFFVYNNLGQLLNIELYDYESIGSDEYVGGVLIDFQSYTTGSNKYPSTITVNSVGSNGTTTIKLDVIWLE